jgi:hypothetical protein
MAFLGLSLPKRNRFSDFLGQVGRAAIDVVSPNTPADIQRRLAAGQPASYQAQQAQIAAQRPAQQPSQQPFTRINASQFGAPLPQTRIPSQPRIPTVPSSDNRNLFSKIYDQINPLDANRTFKQATPTVNKNAVQQLGQVGGQFTRGTVGGIAKLVNTGVATVPQVAEIARTGVGALTQNYAANAASAARMQKNFQRYGNKGILGVGSFVTPQEAQKGQLTTGLKKIGGGTLQAQTEAAGLMLTGFGGSKFLEDLGKVGITQAAATQLPNIAKAGITNVAQGGITALNQGASAKEALKAAGISGVTGTLGDIGLGLVGNVAKNELKTLGAAKTIGLTRQQLTPSASAERVPRSNVSVFGGNVDTLTKNKTDALIKQAAATPVTPGTVRVFQSIGKDGQTNWVTNNVDRLISYKNATTSPQDVFKFMDVPPSQLQKTSRGADIFQLKDTNVPTPTQIPALQAGKTPIQNAIAPIPPEKVRGFTKSIQQSPEISPELQKTATGTYTPITKKETLATTEKLLQGDISKVQSDVLSRISSKNAPDAQLISDSIGLMKQLDAGGNHELANSLQEQMSKKLTESGQTVWAASLLNNRTPEGVLYGARKALSTAGISITPDMESGLQSAISKIKVTKGAEKDMAIKELQRFVAQQIPSSFADKAVTLWKAGLLTGVKTQTGNALSNVSSIALKKSSDPLAAAIDTGLSLFTGQRTKTATLRGLGGGATEGLQKAVKFMKTGIDERTALNNKFDVQLTNYGKSLPGRAAQTYTDFVFNLMGAADRPYYYATLRNNLNDIALAQAKNQGLNGVAKSQFIKQFVEKPPENILQTAIDAANKSIFANDTLLSNLAGGVRNNAGKFKPVIESIMPFTKVPSAIVTRVFDYTPVGAVKTVAKQIASGKLDQRALAEGLAEAGTGTGAIWLGYQLSQGGLMTGAQPTDKTEQELWKLEGKQPYSIKFGDKWYSLNYTSPLGQIMAVGNNMSDAQKKGESFGGQLSAGAGGAGQAVVNQSFLQGLQGGLSALTDPNRSAANYVKQQASSIIPTLVNDITKATDQYQRQAYTPIEAIQAKIPGQAQKLPVKTDVFGQPMTQKAGPLETIASPLRPSRIPAKTDLNTELRRLQDVNQGILPDISKTNFFGKDTKIDKKTVDIVKTQLGPQIQSAWSAAVVDPNYQKLNDTEKRRALDKLKNDLTAVYKYQNASKFNQKQPETKLTADQQLIANGNKPKLAQPKTKKVKTPKIASRTAKSRTSKGRARVSKININQFIKNPKVRTPAKVKLRVVAAPIARVQPAVKFQRPKVTIKKSKV